MISQKALKALEYDKIMKDVASFAVLENTKKALSSFVPLISLKEVESELNHTEEAYQYLYKYSVGGIYYFDDITDALKRVDIGGVLNNLELLKVASNLKSARVLRSSIEVVNDESLSLIKEITSRLYVNPEFEKEITDKIAITHLQNFIQLEEV